MFFNIFLVKTFRYNIIVITDTICLIIDNTWGLKMRRDLNSLGFNFWCLFNRLPTQYILATHTYWQQTSYWQHILIGNKLATDILIFTYWQHIHICTYWQHLIIINTYLFATHTYWQRIPIGNTCILAIHTYLQHISIDYTYLFHLHFYLPYN